MNKLEQLDQQIASQLNNNMANASIPRSMNESAMTTIGNKLHTSRNNKSVDRKKNSTPHSFVGPSPSLDTFTNNKISIIP